MKNVSQITIDRMEHQQIPEIRVYLVNVIRLVQMVIVILLVANASAIKVMLVVNAQNVKLVLKVNIAQNVHVMFVEQWKVENVNHIVNAR